MRVTESRLEQLTDVGRAFYLIDIMYDELGPTKLCCELIKAMSIVDIIENLEYIAKIHDIKLTSEEDNNEN